jgi:hypothetical protein
MNHSYLCFSSQDKIQTRLYRRRVDERLLIEMNNPIFIRQILLLSVELERPGFVFALLVRKMFGPGTSMI